MSLSDVRPGQIVSDGNADYEVLTFPSYKDFHVFVEVRCENWNRAILMEGPAPLTLYEA